MIKNYIHCSKVDKRRKMIMVLDIETAGSCDDNPLAYDIGFVVTDKLGTIYKTGSYLVEEIFDDDAMMKTAYYYDKMPLYREKLKNNEITLKPFMYIRKVIHNTLKEYNISQVSAYNLDFDYNGLNNTLRELNSRYVMNNYKGKRDFSKINMFFTYEQMKKIKLECIWAFACQTIFIQKSFPRFAYENDFYNKKSKNVLTNAEVAYNWLHKTKDFKEEHTGLSDSLIETEIMAWCYKQNKKRRKGIIKDCWKTPQFSFRKKFKFGYPQYLFRKTW